ncbi:hypothetical protein HOP61_04985 [Halomonas daqingensis]|uniref:Uncharacterized protein n=1 Tax=Billgrantia desiderata TaxID=52021 RepID=A0AAW4YRQ7_9GAMM|nr:hypothetical protein [Halomonas desiderata]MCE8050641.1 hypothetical protein [Halomonas desiderata]
MPREMPNLALSFANSVDGAVELVKGVESARSKLGSEDSRQCLPVPRIELTYELSFLRIFNAWEDFLEQGLLRYMCGYEARHGQEDPIDGVFCKSLRSAKVKLNSGQQYLLWHNPGKVVRRAAMHLRNSRHEVVITSMQGRIENFAAIRHRIAHAHAREEFDRASMALAGKRYLGSRPGKFLRDWAPHTNVPSRWLEVVSIELKGLAFQIVPK